MELLEYWIDRFKHYSEKDSWTKDEVKDLLIKIQESLKKDEEQEDNPNKSLAW